MNTAIEKRDNVSPQNAGAERRPDRTAEGLVMGITDSTWNRLFKIGGAAALLVVVAGVLEVLITFLPGGERVAPDSVTVVDWFALYQDSALMGLRNLGLVNIALMLLGIPVFFALYGAHRDAYRPYALLAMILSFIGAGVFLATNRAFPFLALSNQYAAATTDAQRAMLEAAGQAMLAVGESHTPGTFLGFFLTETAGLFISAVMLRSGVVGRAAAYVGIVAFACMIAYEISSSFVPSLFDVGMVVVMLGGLLSIAWYILLARGLFRLGAT